MSFYIAINRPPAASHQSPYFSELDLSQVKTAEAIARAIFDDEIPYPSTVWFADTQAKLLLDETEKVAKLVRDLHYEFGATPSAELDQWLYTNDAQFIYEEDRNEDV